MMKDIMTVSELNLAWLAGDLYLSSTLEMSYYNTFDRPSLYKALDERRAARNLTWAQVAREIGVATNTLAATEKPGRMESDGMLAMVRWLGCAPERFIRSGDGLSIPEPPPATGFRRVDTKALHAALDRERRVRGLSWQQLAEELGRDISGAMLTRLGKGGRIGVHVLVAAAGWLKQNVNTFSRPA
jgi:transcriptional regulator with XRE-family HTH domain